MERVFSKKFESEAKKQKGEFLSVLLDTLTANVLPTFMTSIAKGRKVVRDSDRVVQVSEEINRTDWDF